MKQFLGVIRHEFGMSIRRKSVWIAYGLIVILFGQMLFTPDTHDPGLIRQHVWSDSGSIAYLFNMLFPLIGGILAADRMQRDYRIGVRELQRSTPLSRIVYILGKYIGVLASISLPPLLGVLVATILLVIVGEVTLIYIPTVAIAFMLICFPSLVFVTAFSLACPLIIPLRVYQILFTGYWFWGNFLSPDIFPTISRTVLNASGVYALQGFFGTESYSPDKEPFTSLDASLNLLALSACVVIVLFVLNRYLTQQEKNA